MNSKGVCAQGTSIQLILCSLIAPLHRLVPRTWKFSPARAQRCNKTPHKNIWNDSNVNCLCVYSNISNVRSTCTENLLRIVHIVVPPSFYQHKTSMQTRRNVTAYVGLPSGRKIGVSVGNEPNSCGVQIVTVTNVTEKSVMSGILFPGDIITQLNGRNVPSDEMAFTDDLSVEDFQDLAVDEFVQMLNVAGEVRYLLITHDQTMESIPHMAAQMVSVSGKSIDVRVSNSEKLGISVALEGRKNVSGLDMTINKLMPSKRSNAPLQISHVSESSQLNGQVCVGDQITHVNGHLLIGIYPGEFVEILKDIGIDKNNGLVLTIRRA